MIAGSVRLAPGFGLTNRFIIDQHFRQRDRLGRLLTALAYNPFAVGIGLDEDTAAFIGPDETLEVEGSGGVTIVDASDVSYSSIGQVAEGQPVCMLGPAAAHPVGGRDLQPATRIASRRRAAAAEASSPPPSSARHVASNNYYTSNLHAHPRSFRLRRPLAVRALPGHPPGARSRRARSVAHRPARAPRFVDALAAALPGPGRARLLVPRARRLPPPHARGRGHLARPRARARRDRAAEHRRRGGHLRQDAQRRRARASTPSSTSTRSATRASPPASSACGCCARCCPTQLRPAGSVPEGWNWPEARDEFIRFAQRRALGPSTASLVRAAEAARHPVAAPERPVAGAARPRQVPAAHPGDGHRPHAAHRGRARERQGRDQQDPRRPRPAGAAAGTGATARAQAVRAARRIGFPVVTKPYNGNHGRGISIRLTTDEEVAHGFDVRARALALGDRRDLPRRRRSPPAGRQRRAGGGDAPHARARRRRRRAHDRAAHRDREPGSAPRRRPREGADAARARRAGAEDARARRAHRGVGAAGGRGRLPALDRQSVDRRHGDRRHRRHPPRQPRDGRARDARHRPRRRRRRLPLQGHHRELPRDRRRHLRGQRRARLPHARGAERGHAARRRRRR